MTIYLSCDTDEMGIKEIIEKEHINSLQNYLHKDLLKSGVKFIRKKRCECDFTLCNINNVETCLWCIDVIAEKVYVSSKYIVGYGKYKIESIAYILINDYEYCKFMTEKHPESQLGRYTNCIK